MQAVHLPTLMSLATRFRVRHVVDASGTVSAAIADPVGARHGTDVSALLDDPDVDVVLVATPDSLHPRQAIDACRAGKRAVLVEKPLALTPGEAAAIAAASRDSGVPVLVGTMHAHDPAFRAALPYLSDAGIVTIETVFGPNDAAIVDATDLVVGAADVADPIATLMALGAPTILAGVHAGDAWFIASRLLLGLSTHDLAILRLAHGEPSAILDARVVDAGLQVTLGYDSGLTATLLAYPTETKHHSWRARWLGPHRVVEVSFPVTFSSSAGSTLEVHERDDRFTRTERWSGRNETGFRHEWLHLHDVVHGLAEPSPSVEDAAADVALIQRIVQAGAGTDDLPASGGRKVALTAAGWVATVHAPIVAGLGHRVSAVASRTLRSAERIAWPHGAAASTVEELDLDGVVDTVIVAGPPATHAEQALRALDEVEFVLVEKPLTTTLADADRLAEHDGRVGYLENWAHAPLVRASIAHRNDVGRLQRVDVRCLHPAPGWGNHLAPEWGGGCLFDLGPHPIWWALALLGEPVTGVQATFAADDTQVEVELRTGSGVPATVVVSWQQPAGRMVVDALIAGDDGTLRATFEPRSSLVLDPGGNLPHAEPGPRLIGGALRKSGYVQQLESFLGDDWTDLPTAAVGRDVLEIICASYASDGAGGSWVDLPFTGPRDRTPYELRRPNP